jgi:hypothetical protein
MGNAGRNGGEYYTPRPLIRAMIQVIKPKFGERKGGNRHQKHLPLEHRQRGVGVAQGTSLKPPFDPRLPAGHLPRCWRQYRRFVFSEGRDNTQDLVLRT